ncbi:MAG: TauD/TfdA family dioxygenase [Caulobacteraceae bacterium]
MTFQSLTAAPTTPYVGAELSGIDLTAPLTNQGIQDIHDALIAYGVIFFRDQPISLERLKELGHCFGRLHIHTGVRGLSQEHPEITHVHSDETSKHVNGEVWHTDLSCDPIPPLGSILHMKVLPPSGGDTLFASMYRAYDALSDRMKAYLEGLTATHDGGLAFKRFNPNGTYKISTHPVIAVHPVTRKKLIYVNRGFTAHINELSPEESAAVLGFLFNHCERPEWQTRFRWEKDSIAFWDNRCTQHLAVWDYFPHVRTGYRVQIAGEAAPLAEAPPIQ